MVCFGPLDLDPTAPRTPGGPWRRPAAFLHPGAAAPWPGSLELADVGGFLNSVYQNVKGKHQRHEELTANVARGLARAERGRGGRFAAAAFSEARVPRVQQMVKGGCGVEGKRFIALGLRGEQGNPEQCGIERGCNGVRLGSDSRKKNRALTSGSMLSDAERREREGVRARACWAGEGELGRARPRGGERVGPQGKREQAGARLRLGFCFLSFLKLFSVFFSQFLFQRKF